MCCVLHVQAFDNLPEYVQKELQELVLKPKEENKPNDLLEDFEFDDAGVYEEEEFDDEEQSIEEGEEGVDDE